MRILFTAAPEVGHIAPLLGVAAAARDAGHEVVIATHVSRHPLIAQAGVETASAGLSGEEINLERLRRWPETRALPATQWGVRMWVQIAAPAMAADVSTIIARWRPDVVVHEEGEYAAPAAAAGAGIPWVTHGWGSPIRPTSELEALEREVGEAGFWAGYGLDPPRFGGLYAYGLIDPCPPFLNTEPPPIAAGWPVRPSILGADSPGQRTPSSARRCYIGFGTVPAFANAADDITAAAQASASTGLHVVATVNDAALARSLTDLGVDVRSFVSLPDLLPECNLVVTHGGAGTTLAALSYGIPVIVMPQGAPSQERMAAAVERAGVGRSVRARAELTDAVVHAASDPEVARRATDAARTIRSMPAPQTRIPLLEGIGGR